MPIAHAVLPSRDLAALKAFYGDLLRLPARIEDSDLVLSIGPSLLTFRMTPGTVGSHFAFDVPSNRFMDAKAWLLERVPLLVGPDGRDEFHFESWNAHAIYFRDPDGNVGELIARDRVGQERHGPFDSGFLLHLSEIGVPTPAVPDLARSLGLPVYKDSSVDFAAVGDEHGLLILVREGRPWWPDSKTPALAEPIDLALERGERKVRYPMSSKPPG